MLLLNHVLLLYPCMYEAGVCWKRVASYLVGSDAVLFVELASPCLAGVVSRRKVCFYLHYIG